MEFSNPLPHKAHTGSIIRPIQPMGGSPVQRTGVSTMPDVNSRLSFSQPPAFSAPKVNAGNPNPLDAQYFTDVGKLDTYFQTQTADIGVGIEQAKANADLTYKGIAQSRAEAQQSSDRANRDIGQAFDTLAHNQPIDIRNQTNSSNKSGLLYSGFQNDALNNINFQYGQKRQSLTNQQADVKQQLVNQLARLDLQRQGTQQGLAAALAGYQNQLKDLTSNFGPEGYERKSALQAAIDRQVARDQAAAALGAGTPQGTTGIPLPSAFGRAGGAVWDPRGFFVKQRPDGKTEHIYPNGTVRVF